MLHPAISELVRQSGLKHDPFGSTMMVYFPLCDLITDFGATVPSECDFRQSPFGSDCDDPYYGELADAVNGEWDCEPLTVDDMIYAARVFNRYVALLKNFGKDY